MRKLFNITAILGAAGVAAGALGAHALKDVLHNQGTSSAWETAVLYHLIHVPALLAIILHAKDKQTSCPWLGRAGAFWIAGVIFFSGSLYALSLGGPRWLGPITPLGGLLLIVGWLCLFGASSKSLKPPSS